VSTLVVVAVVVVVVVVPVVVVPLPFFLSAWGSVSELGWLLQSWVALAVFTFGWVPGSGKEEPPSGVKPLSLLVLLVMLLVMVFVMASAMVLAVVLAVAQ